MMFFGVFGFIFVSVERVVNVFGGYDQGGYIGDGDCYEVVGVVYRGEYVILVLEMKNKWVVNMVKVIESICCNWILVNLWFGYYEGGKVMERECFGQDIDCLNWVVEKLERVLRNFFWLVKSYVLLSDINVVQDLQKSLEKLFIRID